MTSFGKNFIAPQKKVEHNRSFVIKHNDSATRTEKRVSDEEKIKNLLENNPIKKMIQERNKKLNDEKTVQNNNNINNSSVQQFKKNDRVFHTKFGVGKIIDVKDIGSSSMLIVDFGNQGQKALDAAFAQLKKF